MTKRAVLGCLLAIGLGQFLPLAAQPLTDDEHLLLGTNPDQDGALLEIVSPHFAHVRFQVSRTSTLEYLSWIDGVGDLAGEKEFLADAAGDGVANLYKFGLEWESAESLIPIRDVMPRQVSVSVGDRGFEAIECVARIKPKWNRVVYSLEGDNGNGDWTEAGFPEPFLREELGHGLERLTFRDNVPSLQVNARRLRLSIRYEPAPTIFAHYVSDLNPGWSAMGHLAQPIPAWFRLFHDQPLRMQPTPKGPDDRFRSTGGVHRDLPLLPPGFSFSSAVESAELEIKRARRAGIDGFAVNCLGGKTDFLEAFFDAAASLDQDGGGYPPFQITLSIDINVVPFEDREMLVAVADLIGKWLIAGERLERRAHLARRGGKPLVMGYQSHWIWIDYLERLVELWEREDGLRNGWRDDRLSWPESFGPAPDVPVLPRAVVAEYRGRVRARLAQMDSLEDPLGDEELRKDLDYFRTKGFSARLALAEARQSVARRAARAEAARKWARDPDGWNYIREAYRLLERMVGEEIFWQFDAVDLDSIAGDPERALRVVGRDFPAVNMFLPKGDFTPLARRVVRESGAEWGEPIYAQYVAYGQNEKRGFYLGNVHGGDGTGVFRKGWYQAMGKNLETGEPVVNAGPSGTPDGRSSLLQYTTWNDYGEHTHLAPGLQLGYALTELSRVFIHTWKTGRAPAELGEQVFVFYRKYPEMSQSASFPFQRGREFHPAGFEVITILREGQGRLDLLREDLAEADGFAPRSENRELRGGFQVERYAAAGESDLWSEGTVTARVVKASGETLTATGWEEVTHRPFRQDYSLAGASSRCGELWREDMPDEGMARFTYSEYGDVDRDGLPNWFEMLYFGQGWLNLEDQSGADPQGDENRDGTTNLAHFRDGTNPVFFIEPIPYHEDARGRLRPFQIDPRGRTRVEAEEFDRGGLGVAYGRGGFESMQAGAYRKTRYDLVSHRKVDAHEEDGGDWMVAPLADGEWQTYTVEIPAGCYQVSVRVRAGGGRMAVELDDIEVLEAHIEDRGLWSTQVLGTIEVTPEQAGKRVLRLRFVSPGYGLNWIEFERCRRKLRE